MLINILLNYYNLDRLSKDVDRDDENTPLILNQLSVSLNNLSSTLHDLPKSIEDSGSPYDYVDNLKQSTSSLRSTLLDLKSDVRSQILPANRSIHQQLPPHLESAMDLRTEIRSLKGLLLNKRNLYLNSPTRSPQ